MLLVAQPSSRPGGLTLRNVVVEEMLSCVANYKALCRSGYPVAGKKINDVKVQFYYPQSPYRDSGRRDFDRCHFQRGLLAGESRGSRDIGLFVFQS